MGIAARIVHRIPSNISRKGKALWFVDGVNVNGTGTRLVLGRRVRAHKRKRGKPPEVSAEPLSPFTV
jgi:hypothetical protein